MEKNIRQYFHKDHVVKLEEQLKFLGSREIDWILDDLEKARDQDNRYKITNMRFNLENKSIDLVFKSESTNQVISKFLIPS